MAFAEIHALPSPPKSLKDQETGQELTYRAQWARRLVREQLTQELNILQTLPLDDVPGRLHQLPPGQVPWTPDSLPPLPDILHHGDTTHGREYKLCVIGAGITGLYIALIFDTLKIPGVSLDFFEASDRVGGRCLTHEFSKIPHDYYDIGAMRFPDIKVMKRTFDLFKRTGTKTIPYYFSKDTVNCPMLFNNVRILKSKDSPKWSANPFGVNGVSNVYTNRDPASIMSEVIKEYVDALNENFAAGFKKLMTVDHYSVREYLIQRTKYNDYRGIEYLETFAGSSTSFNSAFSEYVIDAIDFAAENWWCVEDGTETFVKNIWKQLQTKPHTNKKVTRIAKDPRTRTSRRTMVVNVQDEEEDRHYDTVFCTPTLGCIQKMDLTQAQLNWGQKCAVRALTYGPSTKVAIKFSRPWWITECGITKAGVGSTDEFIRTCVYPSYNLDDGEQNPAVLLCSYSWRQDSLRVGSLVQPDSPNGEEELKDLLLRGLARLHNISYDIIKSLYVTHYAWNWHQDPNSMGAFAAFGPADFSTLYPYLTRPAGGGMLHFAGEAISAHHAWIVGALESGYCAVSKFFQRFHMWTAQRELRAKFGPPPGEVEDGDNGTEHLQVLLGCLSEAERERLEEAMFGRWGPGGMGLPMKH
ncbi:hypothetical protein F4802DRAFT_591631 [Xylaria palmicola]|nr:hypothetical protein F4802DRAFT_591631 [Xylaria palmicola]